MNIALHDSDSTGFPNLALMKMSAAKKAEGHAVDWFSPLHFRGDEVFSSKVFTFTKEYPYLPDEAIKGGIGYGSELELDEATEHICPDYSLYEMDYSLGFLTRGCPRKCKWCFVPKKEGDIRANADIEEFARHKSVVLLDNNVLAHSHGIEQIEKMARIGLKVDFNQGIDARLIDDCIAKRLAKLKWLKPVRLACDQASQIEMVRKAVETLRWNNVTPRAYFCYVLVQDIDDALERVRMLKGMGVDPFAQPYIDKDGTPPTDEQRQFARWVNHKAIFKTVAWEDYNGKSDKP